MTSAEAQAVFEQFLKSNGASPDLRSPHAGFDLAVLFYSRVRAEDCDVAADGDMLLFQWGTYDWGAGLHFSFNITRQFIPGLTTDPPMEADFPILQLSWTFAFKPRPDLRALSSGNRWCHNPGSLPEFDAYVRSLAVHSAVAGAEADAVTLTYEDVE